MIGSQLKEVDNCMGLAEVIKDTMDSALKGYLESEEYQQQTDEIDQLEEELKAVLAPDQKKLLMCLLDKINDCNGRLASEAYVSGAFQGIAFHDKYVPRT